MINEEIITPNLKVFFSIYQNMRTSEIHIMHCQKYTSYELTFLHHHIAMRAC